MTIDDFLKSRYVRGGRSVSDADCYGLVRLARVALFGKPLLPAFAAIAPEDKRSLTAACGQVLALEGFKECQPVAGAIATAWRVRLCVHVGIVVEVDGRLWVLETGEKSGPSLTPLPKFESHYTRVIYYDNTNYSGQ